MYTHDTKIRRCKRNHNSPTYRDWTCLLYTFFKKQQQQKQNIENLNLACKQNIEIIAEVESLPFFSNIAFFYPVLHKSNMHNPQLLLLCFPFMESLWKEEERNPR